MNVSWLLDTRKDSMKYIFFTHSLVCIGLSKYDVGVAKGAPYFRRYGRGLVSKPAITLKNSWGGGYRTPTPLSSEKEAFPYRKHGLFFTATQSRSLEIAITRNRNHPHRVLIHSQKTFGAPCTWPTKVRGRPCFCSCASSRGEFP